MRMGYDCTSIDQNTAGAKHDCASCGLSCPTRVKQSAVITWIRDASDHGCRFIKGLSVSQITHQKNKADGIVGIKDGVQVRISASKVVVSCGSIQTPILLKKSGFAGLNQNVGQNFKVQAY